MWCSLAIASTLALAPSGAMGAIDGRVFTVFGEQLADVDVTLLSGGKTIATTSTDADGRFSFASIRAGNYKVGFSLTGFARAERPVKVESKMRHTIDVWLKIYKMTQIGPFEISGVVKGSEGGGLQGISVSAVPLFEPRDVQITRTMKDGAFIITVIEAGAYVLFTHDGTSHCPDVQLVIADGYLKPIVVNLVRGTRDTTGKCTPN